MSNDENRETVLCILNELGSTSEEVAQTLMEEGIRGGSQSTDCPIAQKLIKEGFKGVEVATEFIELHDGPYSVMLLDNPKHIRRFVNDYDDGKYPDLKHEDWSPYNELS